VTELFLAFLSHALPQLILMFHVLLVISIHHLVSIRIIGVGVHLSTFLVNVGLVGYLLALDDLVCVHLLLHGVEHFFPIDRQVHKLPVDQSNLFVVQ